MRPISKLLGGPLAPLRAALQAGSVSSAELVDASLGSIRESPAGFVEVFEESAQAQARAADARRETGAWIGPLNGVPVAVKDMLDVEGSRTVVGSPKALGDVPPAAADALVVERLKMAGAIIVGKTLVTELGCTGLGHNPHYPAAASPFGGRAAGGSSTGCGVAVGLGQVPVAIGTDTAGSVRIPSAFCGVTGFKPSFGLLSSGGCHPVAGHSLDTIGPLATCVDDCAVVLRVMAGLLDSAPPLQPPPASSLRLLVPVPLAWERLEGPVESAFRGALAALQEAGAAVRELPVPQLGAVHSYLAELASAMKPIMLSEAAAANSQVLDDEARQGMLEPVTRGLLNSGRGFTAVQYLAAQNTRRRLRSVVDPCTRGFDAVLMPTVPIVPPRLEELKTDADIEKANLECMRLTRFANLLGRPAASLPCHAVAASEAETIPVGLMVMGEAGGDDTCLRVALAVQGVLHAAGLGLGGGRLEQAGL